ncbi:DNA-dependent ATPase [Perkinsela sp. CCAP 1560/4]|nr:DNA-dependent ATPase [Perkinsela sp. CCAP 1560/4]|eukprot:KNH05172.1 DNA-dependent ATPase [Perkinsela sp. CCAP 1560/4]
MPPRQRQDNDQSVHIKKVNDGLAAMLHAREIDAHLRNKENPNSPDTYLARFNPKTEIPTVPKNLLESSADAFRNRLDSIRKQRVMQQNSLRCDNSKDSQFENLLTLLEIWTKDIDLNCGNQALAIDHTPAYLSGELRPYQVYGVNWLHSLCHKGVNGILADEMGLGKTFQTIAFLGTLKFERKIPGPHLVLCPLSVLGNWKKEFRAWCPALRAYRFHATGDVRPAMVEAVLLPLAQGMTSPYDVIITTYEMYLAELKYFTKIKWNVLVLDEAHRIKNEESSLTLCMKKLTANHRLLVTGTPLQNNLRELYSLLNFIVPNVFTEGDCFDSWFNVTTGDGDERIVSRLYEILRPVMLRRLKSEVSTNIPPKKEIYVECPLTKLQRDLYLEILSKNHTIVNEGNVAARALNNVLMQMRKCCNHPYLFEGVEEGPPFVTNDKIVHVCGKMEILDKILRRLHDERPTSNSKVLIFSQMTRMLDILEDYCHYRGYTYGRIDGSTNTADREKNMRLFNDMNHDMFLFLLSTRAGGLGINLQAANYVILYDTDWNPQQDLQAQDRAHRLGQTRPVTVLRFISGGTVEERMYTRALKKLYLDAMVVQKSRLRPANSDSESKELLGTIRFGVEAMFKNKDKPLETEDLDVLLNRGEEKIKEYQENLIKTQETTLANYNAGVSEANLYEFEGINFSNEVATSAIIINGIDESVERKHLSDACELCNVFPSDIILSPDRKSAILRMRNVNDAKTLRAKLQKVGSCEKITTMFVSREELITKDMIQETEPVVQEESYGRGMRKRSQYIEEDREKKQVKPLKLPKQVKLPDFRPHHLVPPSVVERIISLFEKEKLLAVEKWKRDEQESGNAESSHKPPKSASLPVALELSPAESAERQELLNRAYQFFNWNAAEAKILHDTMMAEGKENISKICAAMKQYRSSEEVQAYMEAFWKCGQQCYPKTLWESKMQAFKKAEEKNEADRNIKALFAKHASKKNAHRAKGDDGYVQDLERSLIRLVSEGSYSDYMGITERLKALPEYQFDFYLLTRTPSQIRRMLQSLLKRLKKDE